MEVATNDKIRLDGYVAERNCLALWERFLWGFYTVLCLILSSLLLCKCTLCLLAVCGDVMWEKDRLFCSPLKLGDCGLTVAHDS